MCLFVPGCLDIRDEGIQVFRPGNRKKENQEHTIASIQKRLRTVLLDPDLVSRILGENWQRSDVQSELARLGQLAKAGSETQELVARDARGDVGDGQAHVVDAGMVETENVAVAVVERGDEGLEVAAVGCEFGKDRLGLFFC